MTATSTQANLSGFFQNITPPAAPPARKPHRINSEAEAVETAKRLADKWATTAVQRDHERQLPWQEIEEYSDSGLWAISVPPEFGGLGASTWTQAQVIAAVSAADGSIGQIPQNHFYALEVLRVGGAQEQKRFYYERLLAGERFGNALAEIGHRDHKRRTRLEQTDGQWVLNGKKFYCTGAIFAHWIPTVVMQFIGDAEPVSAMVILPRDTPGVTIIDDWDGMGQRVTGSGSVVFENVQIKPEWIVSFQSSFDTPTTIGPNAQILHAAIDLGIGEGALRATLPFLRQHARPWIDANVRQASDDPLTLFAIGNVDVRLHAARALVRRASQLLDEAKLKPDDADAVVAASIAVAGARAASHSAGLLAANKLLELNGTAATARPLGLDTYWRNVRTHTLHDPVRWKYHAIGNYALNGIRPPRIGTL